MAQFELPEGAEIISQPSAPAVGGFALPEGAEIISQPEEGLTGEVSAIQPKVLGGPRKPTKNPKKLRSELMMMTGQGVPAEDIKRYIRAGGFDIDPDTEAWLDQGYTESLAAGDAPEAVEFEYEGPREDVSGLGSAWAGLKSGAMLGFDDEWQALAGATGNKIGSALGMNESTAGFGDIYDQILEAERRYKDEAYNQNRLAYGAGFLPGSILSAPLFEVRGAQLARLPVAGRMAISGAGAGAASGFGNADGNFLDRLGEAAIGGGLGAVLGPAIGLPAARIAENLGGRIRSWVTPRGNAPDSGLEALAVRAPQDPAAMRASAEELTSAGVPARLIDVIDESGRGVVRDAAAKMTPGRQAVASHADEVYASAQDRVAEQARRNIDTNPQTARQMASQIAEEQRAMGPQFDAVRNNPVTLTPELIQAFSTAEGRSVLRAIGRYMTPQEQESLQGFAAGVRQLASIDPRMPPAVRQQIEQAIMADNPLTVDIADKFARVITSRAGETPGLQRVASDYANTVRGAARQQYPDYDAALNQFSAAARVGDAAAGTGRYEGTSDFMRTPPDVYERALAEAVTDPAAIQQGGRTGHLQRLESPDMSDYGGSHHRFAYTTDSGDAVFIDALDVLGDGNYELSIAPMDDTGNVVPYTQGWEGAANALGPGEVRNVMAQLQREINDAQSFQGARVSGAGSREQAVPAMPPEKVERVLRSSPTVSEADALRRRARDEIVDRATSGSGAQAISTARQIAQGSAQRQRNEALLGPEGAQRLQRGMQGEANRVANTRFIDPRTGSQTASRAQDAIVDGFADDAMNVASGGKWGVVRTAAKWLRQGGIRNVDAERLSRDAISEDPARVQAAIDYLEQRGMRRDRAIRFVDAIASANAARIGTADEREVKRPAPNSVRALLNR